MFGSNLFSCFGKNPHLPGVLEATPSSLESNSKSELVRKILHRMDLARIEFRKADSCRRIKTALKMRINPLLEMYFGEHSV